MHSHHLPLALPLLALSLSGCAVFHSNVKGGFACAAPRGTCAPSTAIDDAAIKEIDARKDAPDDRIASASPALRGITPSSGGSVLAALRVVYPAWRDGSGHVHKRTVAYVSVDAEGELPAGDAAIAETSTSGRNLLTIAESAPEITSLSATPALPSAHYEPGDPQDAPAPVPTPRPTPIGAIQAQVRAILAKAPKPAASAPTTIAPTALPRADSGTPFPPQGE